MGVGGIVGVFHKQRGLMLSPDDFWVLSGNNPLTTCVAGIKASISVPGACRHLTISVGDINACRHLLGCQLPCGEDVYIFDAVRQSVCLNTSSLIITVKYIVIRMSTRKST